MLYRLFGKKDKISVNFEYQLTSDAGDDDPQELNVFSPGDVVKGVSTVQTNRHIKILDWSVSIKGRAD
jgi:hypothetical protein